MYLLELVFSLFFVSILWFFFHDWYVYKGNDSAGNDVYHLIGLYKYCSVDGCHKYSFVYCKKMNSNL
ncbi:hypothetical protein HZS_6927 [Henneguya salminicola]|nr:hypothetical protein HZS_6927 [Henneguya salminicola]